MSDESAASKESLPERVARFQRALDAFVERLCEDRTILGAVLVGSLSEETLWRRDGIHLWLIEQDGVTRRLRSDGEGEEVWRTLIEDDIRIWAELIPRTRFKRMIEGSSRTAFQFNYFARRTLVHCTDPALEKWFERANSAATRDRAHELLALTTWLIHVQRHAHRVLRERRDTALAHTTLLEGAQAMAALELVRAGEVFEGILIHRGCELAPERMQIVYGDVLAAPSSPEVQERALAEIESYLEDHGESSLAPLLKVLRRNPHPLSWSELADHFAHTQLYPWHLESACEWLVRRGRLERLSSPFALTKKSRVEVEEPAWILDDEDAYSGAR